MELNASLSLWLFPRQHALFCEHVFSPAVSMGFGALRSNTARSGRLTARRVYLILDCSKCTTARTITMPIHTRGELLWNIVSCVNLETRRRFAVWHCPWWIYIYIYTRKIAPVVRLSWLAPARQLLGGGKAREGSGDETIYAAAKCTQISGPRPHSNATLYRTTKRNWMTKGDWTKRKSSVILWTGLLPGLPHFQRSPRPFQLFRACVKGEGLGSEANIHGNRPGACGYKRAVAGLTIGPIWCPN